MPILIVEDDEFAALYAQTQLAGQGMEHFEICATAEEAYARLGIGSLDIIPPELPDLILLDNVLPGDSGITACARIRAHAPTRSLPVIMITADDSSSSLQQAFAAGANDYLVKPLSPLALRTRVNAVLASQRNEKKIRRESAMNNALLQAISDMGDGIAVLLEERIHWVNDALCRISGYSEKQLLHQPFFDIIHPDERAKAMQYHRQGTGTQPVENRYEVALLHQCGRRVEAEMSTARLQIDGQAQTLVTLCDITIRKNMERDLHLAIQASKRSEERLRTITDHLPVLIAHLDADQRFRFANRTYQHWFGLEPSTLAGVHLARCIAPNEYAHIKRYVEQVLMGSEITFEHTFVRRQENIHVELTFIPERDEKGTVQGFYAMVHDISGYKRQEVQLRELALHDPLTGLPNRNALMRRIDEALLRAERTGDAMAVMFLDLDLFKKVNDSFGHNTGDLLLHQFGQRLLSCVRKTDMVARLAGDEFVVVLERINNGEHSVVGVAQKMIDQMQAPFHAGGHALHLETSIGITLYQRDQAKAISAAELIRHADIAMYEAKRNGRNGYRVVPVS